MSEKLNRREVMIGTASIAATVALPVAVTDEPILPLVASIARMLSHSTQAAAGPRRAGQKAVAPDDGAGGVGGALRGLD